MSDAVNFISIIIFVICWFLIIKKFLLNNRKSVIAVKARVVDKYKSHIPSRYPGIAGEDRYVVVFETNNKRLSFNVSEFSCNNYRLGEKGTLRYKGSQIISFN